MKMRILLPMCVVIGLLLVACGKTEVTVNTNSATAPATKATPASTPASTAVLSSDKIGVPDCDDFIAAYDACVTSKVPESTRAQYKTSIEQWRTSWRQLAANPNTKATLATVCKQAAEQAKVSMKSYDCAF
ncbi:MAG TPA: hypothetical protein VMS31_22165 [Pyrinomonadaceae bacterium]|nr:hypothetical protein [Pyrinomonadaceae bacterium]